MPNINGIVNINKPRGITSFETVKLLENLSGASKAGHAGTLDPDAEGVLLVLLGECTKVSNLFVAGLKGYSGDIILGYKSTTGDATGSLQKSDSENKNLSEDEIKSVLESFVGEYRHKVPEYSAKKYRGKTFYKIKRSGLKPPERMQDSVIKSIELLNYTHPVIKFQLRCTSGTYVRTLAENIAEKLGTSGYLTNLVRTSVHCFMIDDAAAPQKDEWKKGFIEMDSALRKFPYIIVQDAAFEKILHGQGLDENSILKSVEIGNHPQFLSLFAVYSRALRVGGLAEKKSDGSFKLKRVFNFGNNK